MENVEALAVRIEELRSALRHLLEGHKELLDPEVLSVSEDLDKVLIQYYRVQGKEGIDAIAE